MRSKRVAIAFGLLSLSLCMFVAGLATVHRDGLPYRQLVRVRRLAMTFRATGRNLPELSYRRRTPHAAGEPYTIRDAEKVAPGLLAITRLDPVTGRYVVDLLAENGSLVHRWPVDHSHLFGSKNPWGAPHGTKVLADGSVLVGFDTEPGLARIDPCGDPVWAIPDSVHHHVIQADPVGGYWTWRSDWDGSHAQTLLRFDAETGAELETIAFVDDVILPDPQAALLLGVPAGFAFRRTAAGEEASDVFHPNDIEPLPAEYAEAFPQFAVGDLLVSLRNLDMVAVIGRNSHRIRWALQGPWLHQHDPDWQADGTISVFNNNYDRQLSHITVVDPKTNELSMPFGSEGVKFYTLIMGNHQRLPNGNWLVVSSWEGRVIEVTATGAPVREYSNIVNDEYNAVVMNAEHLAPGFFARTPRCQSD